MKTDHWMAIGVLVCNLWLAGGNAWAQGAGANGGGAGNFGGFGGFQQQIQQRLLEGYRNALVVTNDEEWAVISDRVQKVLDAQQESGFGGLGGMVGILGNRAGGGRRGLGGVGGLLNQQSDEEDALREAINSEATSAELKTALSKLQEARKAKQAKVEQAQSELRKVLSLRREAIATLIGLL